MSDAVLPSSVDFGLTITELRFVTVGPEWAIRFVDERVRIIKLLGNAVIDIQHVGSTAILGITAKPILDIALATHNFESRHALDVPLKTLGYTLFYDGDGRSLYTRGSGRTTHHLHIFEKNSSEWWRHLHFRDRLLVSPELAARYSQFKLVAAKQVDGNRDSYQSLKSSFIEEFQNP